MDGRKRRRSPSERPTRQSPRSLQRSGVTLRSHLLHIFSNYLVRVSPGEIIQVWGSWSGGNHVRCCELSQSFPQAWANGAMLFESDCWITAQQAAEMSNYSQVKAKCGSCSCWLYCWNDQWHFDFPSPHHVSPCLVSFISSSLPGVPLSDQQKRAAFPTGARCWDRCGGLAGGNARADHGAALASASLSLTAGNERKSLQHDWISVCAPLPNGAGLLSHCSHCITISKGTNWSIRNVTVWHLISYTAFFTLIYRFNKFDWIHRLLSDQLINPLTSKYNFCQKGCFTFCVWLNDDNLTIK